jgi:phage gp36-like protein
MAYATKQDLVTRFGEAELVSLTDRTGSGHVDDAVVARALADAGAKIDSYLRGRYTLPLAVVPRDLLAPACDIARFQLYSDRPTDTVRERFEDAIAWLKDVAAGRVNLTTSEADEPARVETSPRVKAPTRIFTNDTLKDF